ncbi:MAG TPA: hypothetical protein VNN06_04815 [Ramlibacter sp.]|nr:hypothetical protein [Ramlibacter sp.]
MNAVVIRGSDRPNAFAGGLRPRVAMALLLGMASWGAWAFDSESSLAAMLSTGAGPDERERPQLDVSASSLPRFDNTDGSTWSSRIDVTWLPPRQSALGLSLGMTSYQGPAFSPTPPSLGAAPSVDLGIHWRYTPEGNNRVDVTAWRRLVPPDALTLVQLQQPGYGARVEMQIGPAVPKSGFVADRGFIGLQLESGARVTVRRSGGKPMIYYRSKF